MAKKQICPTRELEQPEGREPLTYFASIGVGPATADGIDSAFFETQRFISWLAAAAAAGSLAAAHHGCDNDEEPFWLGNCNFFIEEMAGEAQRRLQRLRKAAELWRTRAKQSPDRKED